MGNTDFSDFFNFSREFAFMIVRGENGESGNLRGFSGDIVDMPVNFFPFSEMTGGPLG